ncbi:MAG: glycerol-3-phosphate dehydrogenase/oxidase [Fibrobacteria bacterium]|nr:glycerol-3-phosphate dehydrogenase/oxidase [Fibrobacteria bacterium]
MAFYLVQGKGNSIMERNFKQLSGESIDVLVIGGGIYGAWTAYDAALRGLNTVLVDKGDWGSGTSMASSKLIHGGLRYLEQMKFGLVKKALAERKLLAELGPHRVLPLQLAVPLFRGSRVGPRQMKLGLILYDWLAGHGQPVDSHRFLGRSRFTGAYPFINNTNIRAGFTYGDCQTDDARLVLELVSGARKAGAVAVNYASAESLLYEGDTVTGAVIKDGVDGASINIQAKVTINCAGPWNESLLKDPDGPPLTRLNKGVHLLMPPLPTSHAFLIINESDNRIFFMIPWYGKTLLGTTDTDYPGDPDKVSVTREDIDYLLAGANRVFDSITWDRSDVCGAFAGLRSLRNIEGASPSEVTREWSLNDSQPGLLMPIGGKLTSARADSQLIVDRACELLGAIPNEPHPTQVTPFPWSPDIEYELWKSQMLEEAVDLGLPAEMAIWTIFRYGQKIHKIFNLIRTSPELSRPILKGLPFCQAELVYCATHEMVVHLRDLVRRRIPLIILQQLGRESLKAIADKVAPILGWNEKDIEAEVEDIITHYAHIS